VSARPTVPPCWVCGGEDGRPVALAGSSEWIAAYLTVLTGGEVDYYRHYVDWELEHGRVELEGDRLVVHINVCLGCALDVDLRPAVDPGLERWCRQRHKPADVAWARAMDRRYWGGDDG
jgi:hypothetical protein